MPTTTDLRHGLSVRTRITATVTALVLLALAGAGLVVHAVEAQRLDDRNVAEVEKELDEFAILRLDGPASGRAFTSVRDLLEVFLQRNVPDSDELLVGWVGGEPVMQSFPGDDRLTGDPDFLEVAARLAEDGGTARLDTHRGRTLVSAQPVQGDRPGALLVVSFLDEDRAELAETMRTYAIVSGLAVVLIGSVAALLSGRLLRPLRTLRTTAEAISVSDLSRRLPLTGNDDITALTRTVNGMLDRLETAFVGQRQFLDDAGHELRTPLTIVRGHLELLDAADPEEVETTRELVLDEVDRMARLVGDLILLAKTGRPDFLTTHPLDAAELVHGVLAKAKALGDRQWRLDGAPGPGTPAEADAQRLTQALLQLCDNAVKHTRPGDTVAVGAAARDGRLLLWVRDTGPGIPVEERDHVFTRFGRGERRRAAGEEADEGFGLGLSIVRAIAEAHGGTARIEDAPPRGVRVVLDLPARPVPPGRDPADEPAAGPRPDGRPDARADARADPRPHARPHARPDARAQHEEQH